MVELKAETKINLVEDACKAATDAATNANSKAALANTAATNANTAKANADKATAAANTAAANAQAKADLANTAATNANDKAALANEKATAADIAAGRVNEAITQANTAATNAQQQAETAGDAATEAAESVTKINAALARMEELEATLTAKDRKQPTGMTLIYPERITMGNMEAKFVRAELTPAGTGGNVLFLGDDRAVSISPDGFIRTNAPGKSLVHVIPTENTAIYRTIEIQVIAPAIRKVSGVMRLLSGGRIRKM